MEDILPEELNSLLVHFFIKVTKLNGDELEPGTLTSLQRSFDRFVREHGKNYSIIQDKIFEKSQNECNKGCQVKMVVKTRRWVQQTTSLKSFGARKS